MTRQIRTWHESDTSSGAPRRWTVSINDTPIPGGYVEETDDGRFEIHYPRLEPRTFDTLDEAKRRIELAPPITKGAMAIANPVDDEEGDEFLSTDEAGEMLGISRYRVNAMVANGVLAGKRAGGRTLVSRRSVEARLSRSTSSGPIGRFAHTFICYYPSGSAETYRIVEIDPERPEQIPAQADVLDYRQAMSLCAKAKRTGIAEAAKPIAYREFAAQKDLWLAALSAEEPSTSAVEA